jgi:hypothetical protein
MHNIFCVCRIFFIIFYSDRLERMREENYEQKYLFYNLYDI